MDKITYAYLETTNYCNLDCSFCNSLDKGSNKEEIFFSTLSIFFNPVKLQL